MRETKCAYCGEIGHVFDEQCPKYILIHAQAVQERKVWNDNHSRCPNCKNDKLIHTLAGPIHIVGEGYVDNINNAECKCGWHGKVSELIPR